MEIQTWADLVSGLDEALAFAKNDLKLDTTNTRFNAYRTRLDELERSRQQYGDGAALEGFLAEIELNAVALTESQELMAVVAFLRTVALDRAKKKLQIVLKGPDLPADENENSNYARNTMFELNLAARLRRAGVAVEIGGDADLDFTYNGLRWFGECKRPYKLESITNNIGDACQQLGQRLASSRLAARGLLAISISRPLTTKAPYLEFSNEVELRLALKERVGRITQIMQEQMEGLERCRGPQGGFGLLIAHLIMPAWNVRTRMPVGIQYSAGTDIGRDGRGDGQRLWDLVDRTFTR